MGRHHTADRLRYGAPDMRRWLHALTLVAAVAAAEPAAAQAVAPSEARVRAVMAEIEPRRGMSVSPGDGALLKRLTEQVKARRVVELGTFRGYSGLWFALALRNTGGRLITYDIDPATAEVARRNFERAGVSDLVTQIVGDAHLELARLDGPIDLAFIDADKDGYLDYLTQLVPKMRRGGLIVAHNVVRPPPDPAFMRAITTDPRLETTFALMDGAGISISKVK
jgi:caffeoyl-CoA O-methyltransferase